MVKTITVTNKAYEALRKMKESDESFSKLIVRVARTKKTDLRKFLGILSEREADEAMERVRKIRKKTSEEIERGRNVRLG